MRVSLLAIFVLTTTGFGLPIFASAQACSPEGSGCSFGGLTGTCVNNGTGDLYCRTTGTAPTAQSGQNVGTAPRAVTNPNQGSSAGNGTVARLINPLQGGGNLETFLRSILSVVIRFGTIIVILMLVFVGYKFVVAQGKEADIREARQMLMWTVVGALILIGAQVIATGIQATVGALSTG